MIKDARAQEILNALSSGRVVNTSELAARFGVSEMTLRRDLVDLEQQGRIRRVRGGAIKIDGSDPGYLQRSQVHLSEKQLLGQAAAQLVGDATTIYLDAGTTATEVARAIATRCRNEGIRVRVVTHAINISAELVTVAGITVHQLGGEIDPATFGATGPEVIEEIRHMNFDVFFMGVTGVDLAEGFTNSSRIGVEVKRIACARARKVWALADASKWKNVSFYRVAELGVAHGWVTDADLTTDEILALEQAGLAVVRPSKEAEEPTEDMGSRISSADSR